MIKSINAICGVGGNLQGLEQIQNNPNFVFENDPNFETLILYDIDGNIINVNSWLECANYVNGGWTNTVIDKFNGELLIFAISVSVYLIYKIYKGLKNV